MRFSVLLLIASLHGVVACSDPATPPASADTSASEVGGDAASDVPTDASVDVPAETSTGCDRFGFLASGEACPSTGCATISCDCPATFPRNITTCTANGCIVAANCDQVCAAPSRADVLACTGTHGNAKDAGADGCAPRSCMDLGKNCGAVPDGCGKTLECGSCAGTETCGGAGAANVCGCAKTTCAARGKNCGSIADGCGGTLECGTCMGANTCGGGGMSNVCGCLPSGTRTALAKVAANLARSGYTPTWESTENISASDDQYAIAYLSSGTSAQSSFLIAKGFALDLPPAAVVKGIEFRVERRGGVFDEDTDVEDVAARAVKAGALVGVDRKIVGEWPLAEATVVYGGRSDLWGTTWTPADVSNEAFGFALATKFNGISGNSRARVDSVEVTVYFDVPTCGM